MTVDNLSRLSEVITLVMLCHCCCGCCFRAVILSVVVERWALSLEAMLKGGDVVVDVDMDVVCCLHYMLFVCCWPPDEITSTLWQLLIGLFPAWARDLCSLLPTVSTHISLFSWRFLLKYNLLFTASSQHLWTTATVSLFTYDFLLFLLCDHGWWLVIIPWIALLGSRWSRKRKWPDQGLNQGPSHF